MKKTLTTLLTLLSTYSMACTCEMPKFDQIDIERAIMQFLINKHDIYSEDILEIKSSNQRGFLTKTDRVFARISERLDNPEFHQCGLSCAMGMNEKADQKITFLKDGRLCTLNLKTKMKSNTYSQGFSSKVTQKYAPKCDETRQVK